MADRDAIRRAALSLATVAGVVVPLAASADSLDWQPECESGCAATAPGTAPGHDWTAQVGVMAGARPVYDGADHYKASLMPVARVNWRDTISLGLDGIKATVRPLGDKGFHLDAGIGYWLGRREGADKTNGDALRGLGDISANAIASVGAGYRFGPFDLGLDVARDLGGDRDGTTLTLSGGATVIKTASLRLHAGASITWADDNYMGTMFGVTPAQAAASHRYAARGADSDIKDLTFSADANYALTPALSLVGRVSAAELLGDAADSPIVDDAGSPFQFGIAAGMIYGF